MRNSNPVYLDEVDSDILMRLLKLLHAESAMTTDYSNLRHFEGEKLNTRDQIIARANEEFGLDLTPAYELEFGKLFKFIRANKTR